MRSIALAVLADGVTRSLSSPFLRRFNRVGAKRPLRLLNGTKPHVPPNMCRLKYNDFRRQINMNPMRDWHELTGGDEVCHDS